MEPFRKTKRKLLCSFNAQPGQSEQQLSARFEIPRRSLKPEQVSKEGEDLLKHKENFLPSCNTEASSITSPEDNGGTIQPAAGMLNILRKDLCEQKEQPAEGGVENEWGQELPLPKASTMVCGSNRNSAPVTTANAFQNSGILDPDAIAAFYERAVGMGPQQPPRAARSNVAVQPTDPTPALPPIAAVPDIFRPASAAWLPCAEPQLRLASAAPGVENLANGVPTTMAADGNQGLQQGTIIPVSPIVTCKGAVSTDPAATTCSAQQQGPVAGSHAQLQTVHSWPSVILETPDSFPSCDAGKDAVAEAGSDGNATGNAIPLSGESNGEAQRKAVSTGSEFQGFEPGSEKLAPALDFLIRADSMRVLDTPMTEDGGCPITPGLDVAAAPGNQQAPMPPAPTFPGMGFTNAGDPSLHVAGLHSHHQVPNPLHPSTTGPAVNQAGERPIQGFGSGIDGAAASCTAIPQRLTVQDLPGLQQYVGTAVTPGVPERSTSLPSVICDTPIGSDAGHNSAGQHRTGQQSVCLTTPTNPHACTNVAEGRHVANTVSTGSTVAHMHAQQPMVDVTPYGTRDEVSIPDALQTSVDRSPSKRRRRRSRTPLDPAFDTSSQEQLRSASPPPTAHVSLQPAQQIQCAAQPQFALSSSTGGAALSHCHMQQCGAAQATTPLLHWDGSTTTMSTGDAAQQHSVQLTVPGAQMVVGEQGSGRPSSNGGSAAPHIAGKQRGAATETQNAGIFHATASASELMLSADFNRRLEAFLQPVVADVLRRKDGGNMGDNLLHQWQVEVLELPRVLSGRNVVYSAPTSGGKSLVADIIALRRLCATSKAILLVLPFVSLCNEKASHWEKLLSPLGYGVQRYFGGQGRVLPKLPDSTGIAVCTIEKANSLVNAMLEAGTLASSISAVIVDELHMVDDEDRGYLLELLLTKLRFAVPSTDTCAGQSSHRPGSAGSGRSTRLGSAGGSDSPSPTTQAAAMRTQQAGGFTQFVGSMVSTVPSQCDGIQIIGMSATLPNVDLIGKWLKAAVHTTDFRPVELQMSVLQGTQIHRPRSHRAEVDDWYEEAVDLSKWGQPHDPKNPKAKLDPDDQKIGYLVNQTVQERKSVLIFCGTVARVEQTAKDIAKMCAEGMMTIHERSTLYNSGASPSKRAEFIANLSKNTPDALRLCISHGMMTDNRDAVETAFKNGVISVLVATSTVATGVNLPAQRVIIRDNYIGRRENLLNSSRLRQMAGRAGRSGIDTKGECVCVLQNTSPAALNRMKKLMTAPPEKVSSCLTTEKRGMDRIMLEVVATGLVRTAAHILDFIHCTLLAADCEAAALEEMGTDSPQHAPAGIEGTTPPAKPAWQQQVAETCKISIRKLYEQGFVKWSDPRSRKSSVTGDEQACKQRNETSEGHWVPNKLAAAALRANVSPEEALTVNEDVASVAGHLCLESDLHLMYLVAPVKANEVLRWQMVYQVVEHAHNNNPVMRTVCKRTGVDMEFARRLGQSKKTGYKPEKGEYDGGKRKKPDKQRQLYKMYIALILTELVNETPLDKIVKWFYPVDKSLVRTDSAWADYVARHQKEINSLQDEAGRSASMIAAFCERIGYTSLELLVSHFQGRVLHGVKDDLVDLTHLKGVRGSTARLLYTAGLETVECIAESTRDEIHAALCQGKRSNEQQGEWKKAGMILKSAIELLQERANAAKDSLDEATRLLDRNELDSLAQTPHSPGQRHAKSTGTPHGLPSAPQQSPKGGIMPRSPSKAEAPQRPVQNDAAGRNTAPTTAAYSDHLELASRHQRTDFVGRTVPHSSAGVEAVPVLKAATDARHPDPQPVRPMQPQQPPLMHTVGPQPHGQQPQPGTAPAVVPRGAGGLVTGPPQPEPSAVSAPTPVSAPTAVSAAAPVSTAVAASTPGFKPVASEKSLAQRASHAEGQQLVASTGVGQHPRSSASDAHVGRVLQHAPSAAVATAPGHQQRNPPLPVAGQVWEQSSTVRMQPGPPPTGSGAAHPPPVGHGMQHLNHGYQPPSYRPQLQHAFAAPAIVSGAHSSRRSEHPAATQQNACVAAASHTGPHPSSCSTAPTFSTCEVRDQVSGRQLHSTHVAMPHQHRHTAHSSVPPVTTSGVHTNMQNTAARTGAPQHQYQPAQNTVMQHASGGPSHHPAGSSVQYVAPSSGSMSMCRPNQVHSALTMSLPMPAPHRPVPLQLAHGAPHLAHNSHAAVAPGPLMAHARPDAAAAMNASTLPHSTATYMAGVGPSAGAMAMSATSTMPVPSWRAANTAHQPHASAAAGPQGAPDSSHFPAARHPSAAVPMSRAPSTGTGAGYATSSSILPPQPQGRVSAHAPEPMFPLQMLQKSTSTGYVTSNCAHALPVPNGGVHGSFAHSAQLPMPFVSSTGAHSSHQMNDIRAPYQQPQIPNQYRPPGAPWVPISAGNKRPAADGTSAGHTVKAPRYTAQPQAFSAGAEARQQQQQQQHVPPQHQYIQMQQGPQQLQQQQIAEQQVQQKTRTSAVPAGFPVSVAPQAASDRRNAWAPVQQAHPSSDAGRCASFPRSNAVPPSEQPSVKKEVLTVPFAGHTSTATVPTPEGSRRDGDAGNGPIVTPGVENGASAPVAREKKEEPKGLPALTESAEEFKKYFDEQPEGLHLFAHANVTRGLCKAIHACSEVGIELVHCEKVERKEPAQASHRLPPNPFAERRSNSHRAGREHAPEDSQPKPYTIMKGVVVCWDERRCFFINMRLNVCNKYDGPYCFQWWDELRGAMASPAAKVGMGMKDMIGVFRSLGWEQDKLRKFRKYVPGKGLGIEMTGQLSDVRVAASLLQPGSAIVSDADHKRQFPRESDKDKHRVKKPRKNGKTGEGIQGPAEQLLGLVYQLHGWHTSEWGDPKLPSPASYSLVCESEKITAERVKPILEAAREVMHIWALHCQLKPLLEKLELTQVLHTIEWPLCRVLGDMQHRGIPVDVDAVDKQLADVKEVQDALAAEVAKVAKQHGIDNFGLPSSNNPKVRELLYEKLKLIPPPGAKKGEKLSTAAAVLTDLIEHQHDCPKVVQYIMDYRSLCKSREHLDQAEDKSVDVRTLLKTAPHYPISNRSNAGSLLLQVNTSFRQTQGDNGRLSTERPNIQCAPKPKTFSYPVGSDGTCKTLHVNLRSIYRAPEGWSFLSADYCQMELRIMAHLAEESHLISAFNTVGPSGSHGQGIDPFTILAQQMDQKRADVKQLFYAVSYGMGSEQLSKKLGCDINTAKRWKADLLSKFPKIESWPKGVTKTAEQQGYLCTFAAKRRRWFPHINSSDWHEKGAAERAAVNFNCQAGAADVAKWAMIQVEAAVQAAGLQQSMQMCLQIHDELVFLVKNDDVDQCARLVRQSMEGAAESPGMWQLDVPMKVKISIGPSWGELEEYKSSRIRE